MGGYLNAIQSGIRRAMRGQTPPFLPEGYAYSQPEAAAAEPVRPPTLETPTSPPPPLETPSATQRYREIVAQGPPERPQRKGLARVGEILGTLYGVPDEIMAPGYARESARYGADLRGARQLAEIEEGEQRLRADLELRRKQGAQADATAARQRRLAETSPEPLTKVVNGTLVQMQPDGTWKRVYGEDAPREYKPGYGYERDGKVEVPVPTPPKLSTPIPGRDVPYPPEVEEQRRRMAAANRAPERPASPATFRIIESEKARNLRAAERAARKRIAEGIEAEATIWADLEREKEQIQADYEAQIVAAGGSIAEPKAATPAAPPAPAAQSASKYKPGDTVRLKSGKIVRITKINADGTFDYE
jgi:hypothetical protein